MRARRTLEERGRSSFACGPVDAIVYSRPKKRRAPMPSDAHLVRVLLCRRRHQQSDSSSGFCYFTWQRLRLLHSLGSSSPKHFRDGFFFFLFLFFDKQMDTAAATETADVETACRKWRRDARIVNRAFDAPLAFKFATTTTTRPLSRSSQNSQRKRARLTCRLLLVVDSGGARR